MSKAVWNFSKNSSDLVAGPFPKQMYLYFSLVERKVALLFHDMDRKRYLV